MEAYEDDDDTHFCIKCHLTVNGLENYVRHRQSGCRGPEGKQSEVPNETPSTLTTVTYPEILNADAFFSSLELQSSAKSSTSLRSRSVNEKGRKAERMEDKGKKKSRRIQEPDEAGLKEKLLSMPPVVADLDDLMDHLVIPSLVGFPDIVTTTGAKSSTLPSTKSAGATSAGKASNHENLSASPVESIMTSSKGSSDRKRSEDPQRIEQDHGEWLDEAMLVDLDANSENKEGDHGELGSYAEYDYRQDEETEEESPDDDADDNDSYSNDDEPEDREYPPRGHTGGKWKPGDLLHDMNRLNEDEDAEDEEHQEHPTILHTGGKWKPAESSQGQQRTEESEFVGKDPGASSSRSPAMTGRLQPPPGLTRGKWIPGAPGDFGSGYWCDPCGRKLASRLLYNRHLLSDLHARRSIQEIDGDLQLPRGAAPIRRRKPASKRQRALAEIKSRATIPSQEEDRGTRKKTRKRQKEVLVCEMCQVRVRRPQMGKHLLSHYHCRVAGTNPSSNPAARRFILENMSNVVRQCPFQCAICRFYCNTEATFLRHWRSTLHTSKLKDTTGSYKCTACDFYCDENDTMEEHLTSTNHREVVAMMNGSIPVVVARHKFLVCETCDQRFRYNVQLRLHVRETEHSGSVSSTDDYQSKIACTHCSQVHRSLVALQRHQLSCHDPEKNVKVDAAETILQPSAPYFCSFCMLNFTSAREAVLHRRTTSHKEIVRAQKLTAENLAALARDCPHCGSRQPSLLEHKEHLLRQHPELCHRCPRCGLLFALPQDVTRHTRDVECTKPTEEYANTATSHDGEWRCNGCSFVTDSQAEFLFHEALHAGSVEETTDQAGCSKTPAKYRCPMCTKLFCKVTLRNHIRSHTGEKPFRCAKCSESFPRRSSLNLHRKECSSSASFFPTWRTEADASRRRNHTCSECNTAFYTNRIAHRYVSYIETYKKRHWLIFKKKATRVNYRLEPYTEFYNATECCTGWRQQREAPLTCSPVCASGCPHSKCTRPNVCECLPDYRTKMIDGRSTCVPVCGNATAYDADVCGGHGRCVRPRECQCGFGYFSYISKGDSPPLETVTCLPRCQPACGMNAYCREPNTCMCNQRYRALSQAKTEVLECLPVCDKDCVNGNCVEPNRCHCLSGYKEDPKDPFVCQPICDHGCVNGICTKPNYCECHQGYVRDPADPERSCAPGCDLPCVNGNCSQPNHCDCHDGYKKSADGPMEACFPVCDPPCVSGACTRPNECECHDGHGKIEGDAAHVCSPICDSPCINADCTGPNHCECHHGYVPSTFQLGLCVPVCDPPCINATCTQPDVCQCLTGYEKKADLSSRVCRPVCDPPCINSDCTGPNNCECHDGYEKGGVTTAACSPVCDPPCVNGICGRPNECECNHGYKRNAKDPPQLCSPVCDPPCSPNSWCNLPNECICDLGYVAVNFTNSSLPVSRPSLENALVCEPLCEPECNENASCIRPDVCRCNSGYRPGSPSEQERSSSECLPICDRSCVNGFCGYPNKCICHLGYRPSRTDDFVCEPFCPSHCINSKCTEPGHCQCDEGYEKISLKPPGARFNLTFTDNICIPSCPGGCASGNCIAPNKCLCHPGYTLTDLSTNSTGQSCRPSCEPNCPEEFLCTAPNQCESRSDQDARDVIEYPTISTDVISATERSPEEGKSLTERNRSMCEDGSFRSTCNQSYFCIVIFEANNDTDQRISGLSSDTLESKRTREVDHDEANGTVGEQINWQYPKCKEDCRISLSSSNTFENSSDKSVRCRRQLSPNISDDFKDQLLDSTEKKIVVCFIKAESECNASKAQVSTFRSTILSAHQGIGIGFFLAAIAVLSLIIYRVYRKKKNGKLAPEVSMNGGIMVEWSEDQYNPNTEW